MRFKSLTILINKAPASKVDALKKKKKSLSAKKSILKKKKRPVKEYTSARLDERTAMANRFGSLGNLRKFQDRSVDYIRRYFDKLIRKEGFAGPDAKFLKKYGEGIIKQFRR